MSIADIVRRPKPPTESARHVDREPRVSLLPPELRAAEGVRAVRRRLIAGVVAAAVLVAAAVTLSAAVALASQVHLLVAGSRTSDLTRQVARYQAITELQGRIALGKVAVRVGSSTSVDWNAYLKRVAAVTPDSLTLTTVAIDSASPVADYAQGSSSIDVPRIGTIVLTAKSSSLDAVPAWLTGLATLPGYADASPQTTSDAESGGYSVVITMHVTDGAYAVPLTEGVGK